MQCLLASATVAFLVACGGIEEQPTSVVYRSLGSRQCEGGGLTLLQTQSILEAAGVQVLSASCGNDGLMRVALCGANDGKIALLDIPQSQNQLALSAGFILAAGLLYVRTPCQ